MIEKCPKCGNMSFIKVPGARIMTERFGILVNTANEHSFKCLHKTCNHKTDTVRIETEEGKKNWFQKFFRWR